MASDYRAAVDEVLDRYRDAVAGDSLAEVVCLKGVRGEAELAGGAVCSGADGVAIRSAIVALGYDEGSMLAVDVSGGLSPDALREIIEAVDPLSIVALDPVAATALADAYHAQVPVARRADINGRAVVALEGFEHSLADERAKRASWHQLKLIPRARKLL